MANSIIQNDGSVCFICGRWGGLQEHHCLFGINRQKADKYGLTVRLCQDCHTGGKFAVHRCQDTARKLQRIAQKRAMEFYGWDTEKFIEIFGKNYLAEDEDEGI